MGSDSKVQIDFLPKIDVLPTINVNLEPAPVNVSLALPTAQGPTTQEQPLNLYPTTAPLKQQDNLVFYGLLAAAGFYLYKGKF